MRPIFLAMTRKSKKRRMGKPGNRKRRLAAKRRRLAKT